MCHAAEDLLRVDTSELWWRASPPASPPPLLLLFLRPHVMKRLRPDKGADLSAERCVGVEGGQTGGRASGGRRKRRRRWKFLHFLHTSDDPVGALAFSKDHKNKVLQGNKALRCTSTVRDTGHRVCFWAPNTRLRRKRSNNQSHNHKGKEKSPFQGKTNYGILKKMPRHDIKITLQDDSKQQWKYQ